MNAARTFEMKIIGACWQERNTIEDERGCFWQVSQWQNGKVFQQLNFSRSKYGVLRGMHVQHSQPQGKMIACLQGEILDVIYDLRGDSPTYGVADYKILSQGMSLYAPPGTAHGFQCLTPTCEIVYLCTSLYHRESDTGFQWKDVKAPWIKEIVLNSEKDRGLPTLQDLVRRHAWMLPRKSIAPAQ